jgi:hypothetical protein
VGVATALLAAIGALVFNGISANATRQQTELARQAEITDRYSKAVAQLGDQSIDVRLGAIYALERITHDSPSDQPTITEVLAAFIRDGTSKRPVPDLKLISRSPEPPPADIEAHSWSLVAEIIAMTTHTVR